MAAIAEFDSVGLRYGTGAEVLRDLDFRLAEAGFYFLTGPSGAGKTSLLKLLYLAQRPTRGRIRLFGEELSEAPREALPPFRRKIGVVFQDFRLIRHLSAFDNVALPLRVAGASDEELEGPVREMLAWVGLADRASARPATLSGGEQQRVAIARAVINRPQLLVADEPTGNVDAEMAKRLLHLFTALNRLGTTVVVATHDAFVAEQVRRTVSIRDGRTATETVRRTEQTAEGIDQVISEEFAVLDRAGRLQLPKAHVDALSLKDRVRLRLEEDHVGVFPDRPGNGHLTPAARPPGQGQPPVDPEDLGSAKPARKAELSGEDER